MKISVSSPDEFRSLIKGRKTLCFGCGDYFKLFAFDFGDEADVVGVIDNDADKCGIIVSGGDVSARVYDIAEAAIAFDFSKIVLVITASAYPEIIGQLQALPEFNNVCCYVYAQIKYSELKPVNTLARTCDTPQIPKIIHYCWFGGQPLPEKLNRCIESWRKFCPDYEIVEWNEDNYDYNKNAWTKTAYEEGQWAYLSDYARIDIIATYGGIYLDTDVELIQSLDSLRYNKGFVSTEAHGGINTGSGFGAVAGHRIFSCLIKAFNREFEHCVTFCRNVGRETEVFWRHGYKLHGKLQVIKDTVVLPFNIMTPLINDTGDEYITEATVGIHRFNRGWKVEKDNGAAAQLFI